MLQSTAQSASGTSVTFTDVPAWAKRITIAFFEVRQAAADAVLLRAGAGTVESTGYLCELTLIVNGASSYTESTGFGATRIGGGASDVFSGAITLTNVTGNQWAYSGILTRSGSTGVFLSAGSRTFSGALDTVQLTSKNGTTVFNQGTFNVIYEGYE